MDSGAIADYLASMSDHNKIIVLARIHSLLGKLSNELTFRNIDYVYVGRKSALAKSEPFAKFHAFLKLICNMQDNFCFALIREMIGLSAQEYATVRATAAKMGKSQFQVWYEDYHGLTPYADLFVSQWRHESLGAACFAIKAIFQGAHPYGDPPLKFDVEETFQFIFSWLVKNPKGTVRQYLDWLATYDITDEMQDEIEGLQLMTAHAAKGLEFDIVIVIGANEGIMPSNYKQSIASEELEEERRIFYVAITRAKNQLIVAVRPEIKEIDGKVYESPRSRFIAEMGG